MTTNDSPLSEIMALVATIEKPFAQSLTRQYKERGGLSPKQETCARDLAREVKHDWRKVDVSKTFALLESAKIRQAHLHVAGGDAVIKRNKAGTSYYVTRLGMLLGSVTRDGRFVPGPAMTIGTLAGDVARTLVAFGDDPIGTMTKYGIETGVCGMCGRRLDDPDSVARGIGPVCLKRLGG
jgi:hypothetical protein